LPGKQPPLTIVLPAGWTTSYKSVPIRDQFVGDVPGQITETNMNLAVYTGPINDATGTIYVLWGFPSIGPAPIGAGVANDSGVTTITPDERQKIIYTDGARLLRGTVVDVTCNIGEYGQQPFSVGGQQATGEFFAAAQCQGETDIYGWWAGVYQFNTDILFYAFIEPPSAINASKKPLQSILDSVVFQRDTGTPSSPGASPAAVQNTTPTTTPALH
jgi:hypothetical protein